MGKNLSLSTVVVDVEISVSMIPKKSCTEISENGEPGQNGVTIEPKILADVGLVGFHL